MNMNDQPSYSMLHSLPGGLSIVLYTCSHSGSSRVPICRNSAVRLILGPDMMVIWRENLLHSGAKSRNIGDSTTTMEATNLLPSNCCDKESTVLRSNTTKTIKVKEDLRFFAYVSPKPKKGGQRLKKRATTADGSRIYRLMDNLCDDFNDVEKCKNCKEGAVILDLTEITGYQTGETIIGNLESCGWVVMRGVEVTDVINNKMRSIATKGKWNSISTEKNRQMKYNSNSATPRSWNDVDLVQFRCDVENKLLSQLLHHNHKYRIGKFNLLKNSGYLEHDQDVHCDYPPRLIK